MSSARLKEDTSRPFFTDTVATHINLPAVDIHEKHNQSKRWTTTTLGGMVVHSLLTIPPSISFVVVDAFGAPGVHITIYGGKSG